MQDSLFRLSSSCCLPHCLHALLVVLLCKAHVPQELRVHLQQRQKNNNDVSRSDQSMEVVHNSKIYSLKATQHNRAERQKGMSTVDIQVCGLSVAERPGCKSNNIHNNCIISQTWLNVMDIIQIRGK